MLLRKWTPFTVNSHEQNLVPSHTASSGLYYPVITSIFSLRLQLKKGIWIKSGEQDNEKQFD